MDTALLETAIPVNAAVTSDEAATLLAGSDTASTSTPTTSTPADTGSDTVVETPVAPVPAQPDTAAQLAALQAQVTALTERLTASPPHVAMPSQVDTRQLASALIEAENARQAEFARQQAARADLQPPTFTEDQKTALVSDPDALLAAMNAWARYGAKVALAQVAPHLSDTSRKANIAFELAGPTSDAAADHAYSRARDFAVAGGMSADDFNSVGSTVYDYLWQASQNSDNPHLHFVKLTANPQAITMAARMAHTQSNGNGNGANGANGNGGVTAAQPTPIVDKKSPAPTVGSGTHRADATPRPANVNLTYAEQKLGRKLTAPEIKRLNEVTKKYAAL